MAASSLDANYLELARSMEVSSIPERLRCATCDKLAINAVKLPCCDSTICGDCHESPDKQSATECPICMHSPFAADMCIPAKGLQTTVKVFIKNEAKKRGIDLKTGAKIVSDTPTAAPVEAKDTPAAVETSAIISAVAPASETPTLETGLPPVEGEMTVVAETQTGGLQTNKNAEEKIDDQDANEDDDDDDDDVVITTERPELEEPQQQHEEEGQDQFDMQHSNGNSVSNHNMQMDTNQQGFGFDQGMSGFGNGNGNFGNMNMNMNGFNPMMGMPGFGMGMPNMMGMPGMGMDPSMMFSGNFGGMGDMSMMGMGMGNMGGAMSGMGDFGGMGGPGFFPNQGNYMQSNYGNAHRQNFFNDRGYGRGYGRGFGRGARGNQYGRGRGGWGYQQQQQQQQYGQNQQYAQQQQVGGPQQSGANDMEVANPRRASPSYETGQLPGGTTSVETTEDRPSTAGRPSDQDAGPITNLTGDDTNPTAQSAEQVMENGDVVIASQEDSTQVSVEQNMGNASIHTNGDIHAVDGAQTETDIQPDGLHHEVNGNAQQQHMGFEHNNFGMRGGYRGGRGGYSSSRGQDATELTPAPAPPINAPTGPKAMRQGLPNTGWAGRALTQPKPTPPPAPETKAPTQSVEPAPKEDLKKSDYRRDDRGRSRSRSRSKRRSSKGRERDDEYESDETYARRKERERRKRKEREERHDDEHAASRDGDKSSKKYRSRSQSRTDDSSRRRHRDKEDDHHSSRSHRDRSREKHRRRHHSKSPAKDDAQDDYSRRKSKNHHERDADYESSDRHKDSRRSRKHSTRDDDDYHKDDRRDRSHRSSKYDRSSKNDTRDRDADGERPRPVIEPPSDELGFKIKGSKSAKANKENNASMAPPSSRHDRRSSVQESTTPVTPSDPYAEERARAQQDREAREAQRRMSSSTSLGKRGRGEEEEPFDAPRGPKGDRTRIIKKGRKERRVNYKYEDEVDGNEHGDERDAGRWR